MQSFSLFIIFVILFQPFQLKLSNGEKTIQFSDKWDVYDNRLNETETKLESETYNKKRKVNGSNNSILNHQISEEIINQSEHKENTTLEDFEQKINKFIYFNNSLEIDLLENSSNLNDFVSKTNELNNNTDIHSTYAKIDSNNTRNGLLNAEKVHYSMTEIDITKIAFNDCVKQNVWIDCQLFTDYENNISQIIAKPKNLNERSGTWNEAKNICKKYGSSLLSIESKEKKLFIKSVWSVWYWTSARKNSTTDWIWKSDANHTYTHCMGLYDDYGKHVVRCDEKLSVVCEFDIKANHKITNNTIAELININNNTDYNSAALYECYKNDAWNYCELFVDYEKNISQIIAIPKILNNRFATWHEAMNICKKYNSSLLSIESEEKQKIIQPLLGWSWYWTSGRKNTDRKWMWNSNGNRFAFTYWDSSDTPNDDAVECLATIDNEWRDESCYSQYSVVCEYEIDVNYTNKNTTDELITDTKTEYNNNSITISDCQSSDVWIECKLFIDYNKNISQIIAKPKNESQKNYYWITAMNICNKYNASLISIESEEKQRFINSNIGYLNQFWTSGRKNYFKKWIWNSNGNEFEYNDWVSNKYSTPNDSGVECLSIIGNVWRDIDCNFRRSVVCEFQVNFDSSLVANNTYLELINKTNTAIINKITTRNDGILSDVWYELKLFTDDANNVRQIIAMPKKEYNMYYTWHEAMDFCAKYNSNSVSVESKEKQNFILSFTISTNMYYWSSGRKNLSLIWIWNKSRNEFTYTNWREYNTPNDTNLECLGVGLDYWMDKPCDEKLFSLCEFDI